MNPPPASADISGLDPEKLMAAALSSTPDTSPAFAWVPPPEKDVAQWFPEYEVQALAGRGAMGAVYRAVQRKLGRAVAIKILPAELAGREGVAARFEREARAMAQLNHPNIVSLHDFGRTESGHLFIVMEFVEGADLGRLIHSAEGGLSVPQALEIVSQVCDALQYAHSRGFVHRDIKPGNVLVDPEGRVKIADFGLAKPGVSPSAAGSRDRGAITLTGAAVGTPDYTAPEQLKGGRVDHRADIYSLGVMFYEMLTGELPRGAWALPSHRTAAPARLDEVVTRAMQSEPDNRYQQASEVKAAVHHADGAEPRSGERGQRPPLFTNGILAWLMLACFAWMAFVTPTGDILTYLINAGPLLVLALFFKVRRTPAGAAAAFVAGMAVAAVAAFTVVSVAENGKPQKMSHSGDRSDVLLKLAEGRAAVLTEASLAWLAARDGKSTEDEWKNKSAEQRYALIKGYVQYAQSTLAEYTPAGVRFVFPEEAGKPVIVETVDSASSASYAIRAPRDGKLGELNVALGQKVSAGAVIAVMDAAPVKAELELWREDVISRWWKEMEGANQQMKVIQAELRQLETADAEDNAAIKELTAQISRAGKSAELSPALRGLLEESPDAQRNRLELSKAQSRSALRPQHFSRVNEELSTLESTRGSSKSLIGKLQNADLTDEKAIPVRSLTPEERQRHKDLLSALENRNIKAAQGGVVVSVGKTAGDPVKQGETIAVLEPDNSP